MRQLNLIISLGLLLTLASCEDEVVKCQDTFQKDYNSLKQSFVDIYSPSTTTGEFKLFKQSISAFTAKYPEKCTVDGKVYDLTSDLNKFVQQSTVNELLSAKVIYGKDDRLDISASTDPRHQEWSKAVAVQISKSDIGTNGELSTETIQESMNLCPTEQFANQINPGRCSGFLVGKNILVTAGHCVENQADCNSYQWAFGFKEGVTKLAENQVYSCKKIISQQLSDSTKADFAVIELDRNVEDAKPLSFRTEGEVKKDDPITVMGHPSGLPMKVAAGANIRTNTNDWYFVGNLDTFGGNSGSPVFNTTTGIVEGILVRGETDYSWSSDGNGSSCRVVYQCKDDECRGEDVTRITKVTGLPKVASASSILAEFFENSTLTLSNKGIAFNVQVKLGDESYLAGTKFLDLCALHTASHDEPTNWLESSVVDCKEGREELLQVVEIFKN
ncbi:serine protease [Halobacteriovorax sp. JY17]|uniref:trypsin-like serine peptidase n=1 Tax=Halobacteriovorax sp. JY17 TaxID=2014617 RepID=UPI000C4988F3|nr:serine protease [Halobacteriovorax sp. JY17]PIK16265.1 MAG: hypothetical protein CES88_05880 [Halobacteriovorax sp. JY17]